MARIRSKNTKPELALRHSLHALGYRYRLHDRKLPGSPDLVLRRFGCVCFVHGCFWHRHHDCANATMPRSRQDYWKPKFIANVKRDLEVRHALLDSGWRVAVVWECSLEKSVIEDTVKALEEWLLTDRLEFETGTLKPIRISEAVA